MIPRAILPTMKTLCNQVYQGLRLILGKSTKIFILRLLLIIFEENNIFGGCLDISQNWLMPNISSTSKLVNIPHTSVIYSFPVHVMFFPLFSQASSFLARPNYMGKLQRTSFLFENELVPFPAWNFLFSWKRSLEVSWIVYVLDKHLSYVSPSKYRISFSGIVKTLNVLN